MDRITNDSRNAVSGKERAPTAWPFDDKGKMTPRRSASIYATEPFDDIFSVFDP